MSDESDDDPTRPFPHPGWYVATTDGSGVHRPFRVDGYGSVAQVGPLYPSQAEAMAFITGYDAGWEYAMHPPQDEPAPGGSPPPDARKRPHPGG